MRSEQRCLGGSVHLAGTLVGLQQLQALQVDEENPVIDALEQHANARLAVAERLGHVRRQHHRPAACSGQRPEQREEQEAADDASRENISRRTR